MKINFTAYFKQRNAHGNALVIKGGVRKGKTTLLSMIVKILYKDFAIITNVRFANEVYDNYKDIYYITSIYDYLNYYSKIPYGKPIILIWDDAQALSSMTSLGVMSKGGKDLSSFLVFIGKMETNFIYVAHKSYIPRTIIEGFEPMFIYKLEQKSFIVSNHLFEIDSEVYLDRDRVFIKMPDINDKEKYLPIMSKALTDFKFNINLMELYDKLTERYVGENLKEAVASYLNQLETTDDNHYLTLQNYTLKDLYTAMCLKRGYIIMDKVKVGEIFNAQTLTRARKELRLNGLE